MVHQTVVESFSRPIHELSEAAMGRLGPPTRRVEGLMILSWCARGDLNPHALADTGT